MTKRLIKRVPNRRVRDSIGLEVCFDAELIDEVVKRTSLSRPSVNYILDVYREVIFENINKGRKVELKDFGYTCFFMKKGFWSGIIGRTVPDRYYIKFIFTNRLRRMVRDNVTLDLIPPK